MVDSQKLMHYKNVVLMISDLIFSVYESVLEETGGVPLHNLYEIVAK